MRMSYIRKTALAVMAADNPTGTAEACSLWIIFVVGYQWVKKIKRLTRRIIK